MLDASCCPQDARNEQEFKDHHAAAQPQRSKNEAQESQYHRSLDWTTRRPIYSVDFRQAKTRQDTRLPQSRASEQGL